MQIFIRGESTFAFEGNNIDDLQEHIAEIEGLPIEDQILYCNGRIIDDFNWCEVADGDEITVVGRLLGGKVHGSLARAGKVKGQTPKVEKQEKKKKKTGRAKRRMLYNKRFVNVVQGFGKKRGPNANQ
ncbi:FAU ubiquitin-like and ribosomal protein S30 [Panonychus citri]|uniref:FAU ubiquitin-like and ribosomal protein S30 n=1 Tax=Panonychus citri TaxID=50023 RepID=UPI0023081F5A|nr:FAU ubiquitin-like and ribosomal protein S30 [Panonychus citri]